MKYNALKYKTYKQKDYSCFMLITRRGFLKRGLAALCCAASSRVLAGCTEKEDDVFYLSPLKPNEFETAMGIRVTAPSWIEKKDYPELGSIIDKYDIDFHSFIGVNIGSDRSLLYIPDRIKSFSLDGSPLNCAAGLVVSSNSIIVAWGKEGNSPYPVRVNILPAFPHELAHRWLGAPGIRTNHPDFPQLLLDADAYAQSRSPYFLGSFNNYDQDSYNPSSCA